MELVDRIRRNVFLRLNEVSFSMEEDEEVVLARAYLARFIRDHPHGRLSLRQRKRVTETGPPCEVCGDLLTEAQPLAACSACLTVYHQGCWRPEAPCGAESCAEDR